MKTIELLSGGHSSPEEGVCALEATAWAAGEIFNDRPDCVSGVIRSFAIKLNDLLSHELRNEILLPYAVRVDDDGSVPLQEDGRPYPGKWFGTNTGVHDEVTRALILADWSVRTVAPMALRSAGLEEEAAKLEAMEEVVDEPTALALAAAALAAADAAAAHAAAQQFWDKFDPCSLLRQLIDVGIEKGE